MHAEFVSPQLQQAEILKLASDLHHTIHFQQWAIPEIPRSDTTFVNKQVGVQVREQRIAENEIAVERFADEEHWRVDASILVSSTAAEDLEDNLSRIASRSLVRRITLLHRNAFMRQLAGSWVMHQLVVGKPKIGSAIES